MRFAWAFAAAALAACGGPGVKESFYTLAGPEAAPASGAATGVSVHVGPVVVPETVDRAPMVLRTSPTQVEIAEFHRWAEPLKVAIPRVIAENLMRELGTSRVTWSRLGAGVGSDYRIAIEVQRFESSLSQGALVDALWVVTPAKGGAARTGRSTVQEAAPSADPSGVAAAHSRALARVARDIAAAMK